MKKQYSREELISMVWDVTPRNRKSVVNGKPAIVEVSALGYLSTIALDSLSTEELERRAGIDGKEVAKVAYFFLE